MEGAKIIDIAKFANDSEWQDMVAYHCGEMTNAFKMLNGFAPRESLAVFVRCILHDMEVHNPELWKQSEDIVRILVRSGNLRSDCGHFKMENAQ